jgi:hypothetical protein
VPGQGGPWDENEYRELFRAFPLTGSRPRGPELTALAKRFDRSENAIDAQWQDAVGYCRGARSAASEGLQAYLDRTGGCSGMRR